jgi:hypothetical protein
VILQCGRRNRRGRPARLPQSCPSFPIIAPPFPPRERCACTSPLSLARRQSNAEQIKMMERWFFTLEGRKYDKARGDWRRS